MKLLTGTNAGRTLVAVSFANDWISADMLDDDGQVVKQNLIVRPDRVQLDQAEIAWFLARGTRNTGMFWKLWALDGDSGHFTRRGYLRRGRVVPL